MLHRNKNIIHYLLLCLNTVLLLSAPVHSQDTAEDAFNLARNLYRDAKDYATASELFAEYLLNHPDGPNLAEARLFLARAYKHNSRCDLAIQAYNNFYQQHPDHLSTAAARREQSVCLTAEGRYLEAAHSYENIQRLLPASEFAVDVLLDAAANYTKAEAPEQAERIYAYITTEYKNHILVHMAQYRLALLRFVAGDPETARKLLRTIAAIDPAVKQAPAALLLEGRIDLFLNQADRAQTTFGHLQRRFPTAAQTDSAQLELAEYLFEQSRFVAATDAFSEALKRIKNTELKKRTRLGLAAAHLKNGQAQTALKEYNSLLEGLAPVDPEYLPARLGLAIAAGQTERFADAASLFQQLIRGTPETPEGIASLRELGSLYRRRGDYTRALTWFRRYLEVAQQAPDRNQVHCARGQVYATSGYYDEAIRQFRHLADHATPYLAAQALFGLAQALESNGLPRLALREYVVFLERFPGHAQGPTCRERVEYLREFTVMDAGSLNRALQQALIDELNGLPRQQVLFDLGLALYTHHDLPNAVQTFETYVASYPETPSGAQALFYLVDSLFKLTRQRQLEGNQASSDSLHHLAMQEGRILTRSTYTEWAQRAHLRLIKAAADTLAVDSLRWIQLVNDYTVFLEQHPDTAGAHRVQALIGLGDAQRQLGESNPATLDLAITVYRNLLKQYPQQALTAQVRFGLGICLARQGQYQAAADTLGQFLQDYPGSSLTPHALFELGQVLLQDGQTLKAVSRYQELLLAYPAFKNRRAVQHQLAETHFRLGENARAIELFQQLAEGPANEDPQGQIRRRLAQAYHRHQDFEAALRIYHSVHEEILQPAALDSILLDQASVLVQLNRSEEAIKLYLRIRQKFANSPLARQATKQAAHLYFTEGKYTAAYNTYQPLLDKTTDPQAYGEAILALFRTQRLTEGRKETKAFTKQFPDEKTWPPRLRLEEGQYYLKRQAFDKALKIFNTLAKSKDPNAANGSYYRALTLEAQNTADPSEERWGRALEALTSFVKRYPSSLHTADVHLRLGDYFYQTSRSYLQAAGSYKAVVDNRTATPQARQQAIWMLLRSYEKAYEYDAAHRTAERLLKEFPDHPKARNTRLTIGILLTEKGQYAQAINHLGEILEWAKGDQASEAYFYLGLAYQNLGDYRKAIETYYRISYYGAESSTGWITSADFQRAQCHEALQETASALSIYQRIMNREGRKSPFGASAQERIAFLQQRSVED